MNFIDDQKLQNYKNVTRVETNLYIYRSSIKNRPFKDEVQMSIVRMMINSYIVEVDINQHLFINLQKKIIFRFNNV